MNRDAAVSRIQQTLGFRSDKSSEIVNALQDAQVELEENATLPWFLLTEVASIVTVIGEERVQLPSDFLQEWEEDPLHYFSTESGVEDEDLWTALSKEDLGYLRDNLPGSGAPAAYALDNTYYRIFPTPDAVYTLKHIYYKQDALLTVNIENLWLEHVPFLLIGLAGIQLAIALRDAEALAIFSAWEQRHRALLVRKSEARMHSSRRYIMGGPD